MDAKYLPEEVPMGHNTVDFMVTFNHAHEDIAQYTEQHGVPCNPLNHPAISSDPPLLVIEGKHAGGNVLEARYQVALIAASCVNLWRVWAGDDEDIDHIPVIPGITVVGHQWSLFWHHWDGNAIVQTGGALCGDTSTLLGTWNLYHTLTRLEQWGQRSCLPKVINLLSAGGAPRL